MAKKKKRADDDLPLDDAEPLEPEPIDEEAAVEEEPAVADDEPAVAEDAEEVEPAEEVEDASAAEEVEDAEAVHEAEEAEDVEAAAEEPPPDEEEEVERPPRPRTPTFALVLVILNLLMAPVFLLLLFMDYTARQQWVYATFMNHVIPLGLPFAEEENTAPASFYTRPRLKMDANQLRDAFSKRPKVQSGREDFQPADTIDEPVSYYIRPSQIDDSAKRDLFSGVGEPVATLDEEVSRLKRTVPGKIDEAADEIVKAADSPAKKRALLEKYLLPMAWNTAQPTMPTPKDGTDLPGRTIEDLQAKINSTPDAQLDDLLKKAVQRRMLVDVLAPVEIYRASRNDQAGAVKPGPVEQIVNLETLDVPELQAMLNQRIDDVMQKTLGGRPRDDVDRRHNLAFLMVALSRLKAPEANGPLFDKLFDRSQVVCGLYEFSQAAANYPRTLRFLEQRVLDGIAADREGYIVKGKDGDPTRTAGFAGELADDLANLKRLKTDIEFTTKRIKTLESQYARYQKEYNDRLNLLTELTKTLVDARGKTAKLWQELNVLQAELFQAQTFLAEAAARNAQLEVQIINAEKQLQPKGGKTQ
jgi:hypothetical protein